MNFDLMLKVKNLDSTKKRVFRVENEVQLFKQVIRNEEDFFACSDSNSPFLQISAKHGTQSIFFYNLR